MRPCGYKVDLGTRRQARWQLSLVALLVVRHCRPAVGSSERPLDQLFTANELSEEMISLDLLATIRGLAVYVSRVEVLDGVQGLLDEVSRGTGVFQCSEEVRRGLLAVEFTVSGDLMLSATRLSLRLENANPRRACGGELAS